MMTFAWRWACTSLIASRQASPRPNGKCRIGQYHLPWKASSAKNGYTSATFGLKYYFGGEQKSLIRRHREDDPTDGLFNNAGAAATGAGVLGASCENSPMTIGHGPIAGLSGPLQALQLLRQGGFAMGNALGLAPMPSAKQAEGDFAHDLVHALCHWIEGDLNNRDYWYRRVGPAWKRAQSIELEWKNILERLFVGADA
ncbi:MAG: hypothetical protein U1E15_12500 [Hyphomicrobiales bacterium]